MRENAPRLRKLSGNDRADKTGLTEPLIKPMVTAAIKAAGKLAMLTPGTTKSTISKLKQPFCVRVPPDEHQVTEPNLPRRDQIRKWVNEEALYGAFQVPRTIFVVNTLIKQHVLRFGRALEYELRAGGKHDAILHCLQFQI